MEELESGSAHKINQQEKKQVSCFGEGFPREHVRVCCICKKEFSTGKALGGHMRMHAKDPKQEIRNNSNNFMSDSLLVDHVGKQNCSVCGKDFPSMKSLFGHMRSHPEREWRGIQPPVPVPVPSPSSEYSTLSDDHEVPIVDSSSDSDLDHSVVDLSSRLSMGWSVTAKRGRKGNSASYGSGLKPGIERRTEEAMYHLMMLACANPNSNHLTLTHQSHSDTYNKITWEEEEEKKQGSPKTESTPSASTETETSRRMVVTINKKRRKIKRVKLTELETGGSKDQNQNQSNKHVCSLCNKSFPTHQALGGHRSSHNKTKIIQNQNQNVKEVVEAESHDILLDIAAQADVEVINSNGNGHQCNMCNKIFSTGQALGGHKRCHWNGNAKAPAEAHPPFRLGLIDLNELPAMDEDEQQQDQE